MWFRTRFSAFVCVSVYDFQRTIALAKELNIFAFQHLLSYVVLTHATTYHYQADTFNIIIRTSRIAPHSLVPCVWFELNVNWFRKYFIYIVGELTILYIHKDIVTHDLRCSLSKLRSFANIFLLIQMSNVFIFFPFNHSHRDSCVILCALIVHCLLPCFFANYFVLKLCELIVTFGLDACAPFFNVQFFNRMLYQATNRIAIIFCRSVWFFRVCVCSMVSTDIG